MGSKQRTVLLLALFIFANFKEIKCECKETYMTECDSLVDAYRIKFFKTQSDFIIKPKKEKPREQLTCFNISQFYKTFQNVTSVSVVNQIKSISGALEFWPNQLKYLSFYKNYIPKLKRAYFPFGLNLRKLSLIDNSIKSVEKGTFTLIDVEELNLSNNSIDVIREKVFSVVTKRITVDNNELNYIESKSFPANLTFLSFKNNRLSGIQDDVFDYLVNLQELHLSHNKLQTMPTIVNMSKLEILDLSYNRIESIGYNDFPFRTMLSLRFVGLNNNRLLNVDFVIQSIWHNNGAGMFHNSFEIRLDYNLVKDLKAETYVGYIDPLSAGNWTRTPPMKVSFFGNPWSCKRWRFVKGFFDIVKVELHDCDKFNFGSGVTPYCVSDDVEDLDYATEQFLEVLERKKKQLCKHEEADRNSLSECY